MILSYEMYAGAMHFKYSCIEIGFLITSGILFIAIIIFMIGLITERNLIADYGAKLSICEIASILIMLIIEVIALILS